nr:hypothetical protein [Tanacetum cinerariifolium]
MANLSSADPVYDEAGPSYDTYTFSEVHDHDNYLDNITEYHEEHEMQNDVQPNDIVDSNTEYMSNSNIISYEQITPMGHTEGERGFKQKKTCYLTEVIPSFKTIKEHFKGIQKAIVNEIKKMKEVFDQMKAEVDQYAVDKKCDEIEMKNILIKNENLIHACLTKDVFYTTTYYVLTVSRFSDMHAAYNAAQKCIVEHEAENSNLT